MKLSCKDSAFPYRMVIAGCQFRTAKRIFITEKSRTKPLVYPQIISLIGIGQKITGVIKKGKAETRICSACRHSFPKFRFLKVAPVYIIEYSHRSDIETFRYTKHEVDFHLCLKAFVVAFIIRVRPIIISPSPIKTGERIKIKIIIQPVFLLRKQVIASYSQQIKTNSRDISIKRNIRRGKDRIIAVCTIQPRRHQSKTEFSITGIMRTANHTEIELFIFLFLIGVIKIIKKLLEKTALCLKRV